MSNVFFTALFGGFVDYGVNCKCQQRYGFRLHDKRVQVNDLHPFCVTFAWASLFC